MTETEFSLESFGRKCLLPPAYKEIEQKVIDTAIYKDDVWTVSYPRTGSTWCQEIVWLIGNDLDFEKAKTVLQQLRAPLIETSIVMFDCVDQKIIPIKDQPELKYKRGFLPYSSMPDSNTSKSLYQLFSDSLSFVENMPSPRFIKSHLSLELLPKKLFTVKPKVIYIMRNPKDLCVSYYYHCKIYHKINVDFEIFCELFMNDALPIGSIFNHYFGFWNRRHDENILILRYEDLKTDTRETIKKIAIFMEKPLNDEDADAISEFLSFHNMRKNKACNLQVFFDAIQGDDFYSKAGIHFIRKGIVGDHKNIMTEEMIKKFDKWIQDNICGTDLWF
ncbi:sulfotransferase family cytosolic 1B member 1-like [Sitophilus oryzae]|uniref:Sulfotransferase family cytosolic 1B member 1-like n=1 Tax=Sitophilus oryzae TaxID=7048 RepID=A0A6J2XF47_SITOR|nr:sulfotransferase family cytosolic 1B member 1-like [Sitophilus oryzae]